MKYSHRTSILFLSLVFIFQPLVLCMEQLKVISKIEPVASASEPSFLSELLKAGTTKSDNQFFRMFPGDIWARVLDFLDPSDKALEGGLLDFIHISDRLGRAIADDMLSKLLIKSKDYKEVLRRLHQLMYGNGILLPALSRSCVGLTSYYATIMHQSDAAGCFAKETCLKIPFEKAKNRRSCELVRLHLKKNAEALQLMTADASALITGRVLPAHNVEVNPVWSIYADMLEKELLQNGCDQKWCAELKKYLLREGLPKLNLYWDSTRISLQPNHAKYCDIIQTEPAFKQQVVQFERMAVQDYATLKEASLALYKVYMGLLTYERLIHHYKQAGTFREDMVCKHAAILVFVVLPIIVTACVFFSDRSWIFCLYGVTFIYFFINLYVARDHTFRSLAYDIKERVKEAIEIYMLALRDKFHGGSSQAEIEKDLQAINWPVYACNALIHAASMADRRAT